MKNNNIYFGLIFCTKVRISKEFPFVRYFGGTSILLGTADLSAAVRILSVFLLRGTLRQPPRPSVQFSDHLKFKVNSAVGYYENRLVRYHHSILAQSQTKNQNVGPKKISTQIQFPTKSRLASTERIYTLLCHFNPLFIMRMN
jgi:hypothetical protein